MPDTQWGLPCVPSCAGNHEVQKAHQHAQALLPSARLVSPWPRQPPLMGPVRGGGEVLREQGGEPEGLGFASSLSHLDNSFQLSVPQLRPLSGGISTVPRPRAVRNVTRIRNYSKGAHTPQMSFVTTLTITIASPSPPRTHGPILVSDPTSDCQAWF